VRKQDIYWWVNSYLDAAIAKTLDGFPVMEDYNPVVDVSASKGHRIDYKAEGGGI
jgi:hypothetical protein